MGSVAKTALENEHQLRVREVYAPGTGWVWDALCDCGWESLGCETGREAASEHGQHVSDVLAYQSRAEAALALVRAAVGLPPRNAA